METVIVSSKYQVTLSIPRIIRERHAIHPGQPMQVLSYGDRIELIPVRKAQELRGFLPGPNTFEREIPKS